MEKSLVLFIASVLAFLCLLRGAPAQVYEDAFDPRQIDLTNAPRMGSPDPLVHVIVFDDFQCSQCARFAPVAHQLAEHFPETVAIYFLHFPVTQHHPLAIKMALMAEAAYQLGGDDVFWALHDLFYMRQWTDADKLEAKAEEVIKAAGIDPAQWKDKRNDPAVKSKVRSDLNTGYKLYLRGTPTVFIGNQRFEGYHSFQKLKDILEQLIAQEKAGH